MWDLIVSVPDHCLSFYFAAIHNKMFRAGAKTLVGSGNLKHISGLDMHLY